MRSKSGSMRPTVQKLLSGKRACTCRVESQFGGQVLDHLTGHVDVLTVCVGRRQLSSRGDVGYR